MEHSPPPHLARLLDRVRSLDGPRIQVWAWPGSGAEALLDAVLQIEKAAELPPEGELANVDWLVCRGQPSEADLDRKLLPGQRLLFAAPHRIPPLSGQTPPDPAPSSPALSNSALSDRGQSVVMPQEMLLTLEEIEAMVRQAVPAGPDGLARTLYRLTDGWWRPLALALGGSPEALLEQAADGSALPASVEDFLEEEVVPLFPPAAARALPEIAWVDGLDADLWRQIWSAEDERWDGLRCLRSELGFVLPRGASRSRLPRLLRRWGRKTGKGRTREEILCRATLACQALERPGEGLEFLLVLGDGLRAHRWVDMDWLDHLAATPLRSLEAAWSLAEPQPGTPSDFLRHAARAAEDGSDESLRAMTASAEGNRASLHARPVAVLLRAILAPQSVPGTAWAEAVQAVTALRPLPGGLAALVRALSGDEISAIPHGGDGAQAGERQGSLADRYLGLALAGDVRKLLLGDASATADPAALRSSSAIEERSYRVTLFGLPRVSLRRGGREPAEVDWKLRRAFKIFAYLAAAPSRRAARDELLEVGWRDAEPEVAQRNFHPTLSYLRRSLNRGGSGPSALVFHNQIYGLHEGYRWWVDVGEFERGVERGKALQSSGDAHRAMREWEAAWKLYRGPFLEGLYDPWISERREDYAALYQEMLRRLGDTYLSLGVLDSAMDAYRAVLAVDPLQERIHLNIMRLYARQARRDLVRRQFDRLSRLLRSELGVEPLPETTAEYHRLMG